MAAAHLRWFLRLQAKVSKRLAATTQLIKRRLAGHRVGPTRITSCGRRRAALQGIWARARCCWTQRKKKKKTTPPPDNHKPNTHQPTNPTPSQQSNPVLHTGLGVVCVPSHPLVPRILGASTAVSRAQPCVCCTPTHSREHTCCEEKKISFV